MDPEIQNRGWGSCLLKAAEQTMRNRGIERIFLGQDVCNLFSGVPEPSPEKLAFFDKRGYQMCVDEHYDLEADVTDDPLIDSFDSTGFEPYTVEPLMHGQEQQLLDFLQAEFPGRWLEEIKDFLGSGGNPSELMVLRPRGGAQNCCAAGGTVRSWPHRHRGRSARPPAGRVAFAAFSAAAACTGCAYSVH